MLKSIISRTLFQATIFQASHAVKVVCVCVMETCVLGMVKDIKTNARKNQVKKNLVKVVWKLGNICSETSLMQ